MGGFNVNPTTILGKIHVRTPSQAESLSSRYTFLNLNNAEPNLGRPPEAVTGGLYYSSLTSSELLGIRYALLSNNHSGSAWRVWAYDNPKIATYSKEGSIGLGDNAFPINIKSFVYSNYAYDNQNNRYNSQSFSNKTFNVFALSGIYLFDSTTIGDPASAIAFIVTDEGNVGVGTETPNERLTVVGNISATGTIYANALSANVISISGLNFGCYDYEIHVSGVDGDDTIGNGDLLNPVRTITKALTLVGSARKTVIIHPGTYVENPNITVQYTVLTGPGIIGGNVLISGTVSTNTGCTIQGLKMTNLNITAPATSGNVNIINCDISGILTKSSAADYTLIRFCDIGTINITGANLTAIFGGNPRLITVSNALASVVVKNAVAVRPIVTAGSINLVDCIVPAIASQWVSGTTYAAGNYVYNAAATYIRISSGAGSTAPAADPANWAVVSALGSTDTRIAVTAAASTVVTLANSQIISPLSDDVAPVALNGFYSIFNCVYDKPDSTLVTSSGTGGPTNSIDYFQYINADNLTVQGSVSASDGIAFGRTTILPGISAATLMHATTALSLSITDILLKINIGGTDYALPLYNYTT